jgi:hypothetical protein
MFPVFFLFIMYLFSWPWIIFASFPLHILPYYDNDGRTGQLKQTFLNLPKRLVHIFALTRVLWSLSDRGNSQASGRGQFPSAVPLLLDRKFCNSMRGDSRSHGVNTQSCTLRYTWNV